MAKEFFVFNGTPNDFFAEMQEFALDMRKKGHEIYARWVFRPERGTVDTFSFDNADERIVLLISTEQSRVSDSIIYWLTKTITLDDSAKNLFQQLTIYIRAQISGNALSSG